MSERRKAKHAGRKSGTTTYATAAIDPDDTKVIRCENLVKIYKTRDIETVALQGLDLTIERGEMMAIIGSSGCGKSTLLNMLGGLDKPSAGRLQVGGRDLLSMGDRQLVEYKRSMVGFVWQNNARNLVPYLSAVDNVMLPMDIRRNLSRKAARARALMLLDNVGLSKRLRNTPAQLSGGEQQRLAIALAMANAPHILLADEPTGSVDAKTGAMLLDVFRTFSEENGTTVLIVTHDRQVSEKVGRVVAMRDGKVSSEIIARTPATGALHSLAGLAGLDGDTQTHEEFAILDKAGRLQIPKEYLERLGLTGNKIRMVLEDGEIKLSPPEDAKDKVPTENG